MAEQFENVIEKITEIPVSMRCVDILARREHVLLGISACVGYYTVETITKMIKWAVANFKNYHILLTGKKPLLANFEALSKHRPGYKASQCANSIYNKVKKSLNLVEPNIDIDSKIIVIEKLLTNPLYLEIYSLILEKYRNDISFRQNCRETSRKTLSNSSTNITESMLDIASNYLLWELPFYINTPKILSISSSLLVYHKDVDFFTQLYKNRDKKLIAENQGHLILNFNETPVYKHIVPLINNFGDKMDITQFYGIIDAMPVSVYWKNSQGIYLGCNSFMIKLSRKHSRAAIIGKTDYDMPWKDSASKLREIEQQIIKDKSTYQVEEVSQFENEQKKRVFLSTKSPLYNDDGQIVGIIGVSVDITAEKETEHLKAQLEEQAKFRKIAGQVVHDIRSPLMSLSMIVKSCHDIPEDARICLREAAASINDIANNLLNKYKVEEPSLSSAAEAKAFKDTPKVDNSTILEPIIPSLLALSVVTDKKYQYFNLPIKLTTEITPEAYFAFIKSDYTNFKCMISNLINNAVDAIENKPGEIKLKFSANDHQMKIIIEDSGKGIPKDVIDKIVGNVPITSGKKDGHGIGLAQVRETLKLSNGTLEINSNKGQGTSITLTFKRIPSVAWFANEIKLKPNDIIVVLDDDNSIHQAWETCFKPYANKIKKIVHFNSGNETINFINSSLNINQILLLADYELLNQDLNGLEVINNTFNERSILVTSHYTNINIQNGAIAAKTKILPKQLASEVPIVMEEGKNDKVDLVILDDNRRFLESTRLCFRNEVVDYYDNPRDLICSLNKYAKNTKICIDHDLGPYGNGFEVAETLHKAGFTRICLLSGTDFSPSEVPEYLQVYSKSDFNVFEKLIKE